MTSTRTPDPLVFLAAGGANRRWWVLAAGFAANAAFSAAISGLPAAAVLMRDAYGLTMSGLGLTLGAVGLGIALSELPWGLLTDRIGDRRVLLGGLGLTAAVLLWMALFASPSAQAQPSLLHLTACMALLGLSGGSLNGASGRAVMMWFTDRDRGLAMSIRQTALPLGGAIGALAVPGIVSVGGFGAAYAVLAGGCIAAAAMCLAWLRSPASSAAAGPASASGQPVSSPLRRWPVWRIVGAIGALCVAQIAVLSFIAVFLHDVAGFGVAATSAAMVAYQMAAAALRVWSGAWTDRHANRKPFLRGCSLVTAAVFASLACLALVAGGRADPSTAWALLITLGVGGTVASCWHGVAFTELAVCAGMEHVGTALGMGNTLAFASYFVTPLIVTGAVAAGGWAAAWGLVALCALAAAPMFPNSQASSA